MTAEITPSRRVRVAVRQERPDQKHVKIAGAGLYTLPSSYLDDSRSYSPPPFSRDMLKRILIKEEKPTRFGRATTRVGRMEATGPFALCDNCGQSFAKLQLCSTCKSRRYCGNRCQKRDWKAGHRDQCSVLEAKRREAKVAEAERVLAAQERKLATTTERVRAAQRKRQRAHSNLWLAIAAVAIAAAAAGWSRTSPSSQGHARPPPNGWAGDTKLSTVSMAEHVLGLVGSDSAVQQVSALQDVYAGAFGSPGQLDAEERDWRREQRQELKRLSGSHGGLQAHAQWLWGKLLYSGKVPGTAKWERKALAEQSWRAAAASGHALAMDSLGGLLQQRGNMIEAIGWWKAAIRLAHVPSAAYKLGVCYSSGEGVSEVDLPVAAALYQHADAASVPEPGHAPGTPQRIAQSLWKMSAFTDESMDGVLKRAALKLREVDTLMQRALDPTSVENGLRSKFAHDVAPLKAMGLHNEAPGFQLAEDRLVGERLRDLDCELGMQTRWWDDEVVDDTSSTENYCRFVDACLLAAEDALTVNQSLIGPYAEITFRLEDGALGYLQAFLQAAHRLQELPPLWSDTRLINIADDEWGNCYIRHSIEWRDARELWGDSTARALRSLGKRVDEAIEDRGRWVHVPDLEKKQEDYLSSKEGRKLQRLIARHNWDVKAVLSERPDLRDLFSFDVDNFHFQMPRRRRRTGSHQEAGLARPRERSVSSESPALTEQRRLLREEYPAADYVAIDVPAAGMTTSLTFEADVARVRFQVNMELAAQGKTSCHQAHVCTTLYVGS